MFNSVDSNYLNSQADSTGNFVGEPKRSEQSVVRRAAGSFCQGVANSPLLSSIAVRAVGEISLNCFSFLSQYPQYILPGAVGLALCNGFTSKAKAASAEEPKKFHDVDEFINQSFEEMIQKIRDLTREEGPVLLRINSNKYSMSHEEIETIVKKLEQIDSNVSSYKKEVKRVFEEAIKDKAVFNPNKPASESGELLRPDIEPTADDYRKGALFVAADTVTQGKSVTFLNSLLQMMTGTSGEQATVLGNYWVPNMTTNLETLNPQSNEFNRFDENSLEHYAIVQNLLVGLATPESVKEGWLPMPSKAMSGTYLLDMAKITGKYLLHLTGLKALEGDEIFKRGNKEGDPWLYAIDTGARAVTFITKYPELNKAATQIAASLQEKAKNGQLDQEAIKNFKEAYEVFKNHYPEFQTAFELVGHELATHGDDTFISLLETEGLDEVAIALIQSLPEINAIANGPIGQELQRLVPEKLDEMRDNPELFHRLIEAGNTLIQNVVDESTANAVSGLVSMAASQEELGADVLKGVQNADAEVLVEVAEKSARIVQNLTDNNPKAKENINKLMKQVGDTESEAEPRHYPTWVHNVVSSMTGWALSRREVSSEVLPHDPIDGFEMMRETMQDYDRSVNEGDTIEVEAPAVAVLDAVEKVTSNEVGATVVNNIIENTVTEKSEEEKTFDDIPILPEEVTVPKEEVAEKSEEEQIFDAIPTLGDWM